MRQTDYIYGGSIYRRKSGRDNSGRLLCGRMQVLYRDHTEHSGHNNNQCPSGNPDWLRPGTLSGNKKKLRSLDCVWRENQNEIFHDGSHDGRPHNVVFPTPPLPATAIVNDIKSRSL